MASEYLRMKAREQAKPREEYVMTEAEKRKNWWHYNKWYVVAGILAGGLVIEIVLTVLGVGKVEPDFSIAYTGHVLLTETSVSAIENAFAELAGDYNGDGKTVVQLNQYLSYDPADASAASYAMASQIKLISDLDTRISYFFLTDDPQGFQLDTGVLTDREGKLAEEGDYSFEGRYVTFGDCPQLAAFDFGEQDAFIKSLSIGRRGFFDDKTTENAEECALLWASVTSGVNG